MGIECKRGRAIFGMNHRVSMHKLLFFLLLCPVNSLLQLPTTKYCAPSSKALLSNLRYEMAIAASLMDSTAPNHPTGKEQRSENETSAPQQKSLRRKIAYVESLGEQVARELWEKDPFQATEHVLDSIIGSGRDSFDQTTEAILTPIKLDSDDSTLVSSSGYEDSFDTLYKDNVNDNLLPNSNDETSRDGILGVASIADSPFARILDNHETRKEKMNHFCLKVAYRGNDFCGWQTQLSNMEQPSVQRTLEEWLTELQNDRPFDAEANAETKKARRIAKQNSKVNQTELPQEVSQTNKSKKSEKLKWADLPVAGRTDSGVSAIGQLCRYRTYRKDLTTKQILEYLDSKVQSNANLSRSLRVTEITPVTKAFHPTFTTECRAYAYLIDIDDSDNGHSKTIYSVLEGVRAAEQVALLDAMLRTIEGKTLDYIGLSYGKVKTTNTLCTLHHARARLVEYQSPLSTASARRAVCIELVGDRFLRRMVRLLVEASMRLVAEATTEPASSSEDALLRLIEKQDRTLVGRPAPPDGLIFVAARVQSEE